MKTQFSRRRNSLITRKSAVASALSVGLIVILILVARIFPSLPLAVARPGLSLGATLSFGTHSLSSYFGDRNALTADIDRLTERNLELENENRTLRGRLSDVSALASNSSLDAHGVLAGVIARPPLSPYDTLVVGLADGRVAREGALVYGTGGVPIGAVSRAGNIAQVELFSSAGKETQGWVGEKRQPIRLVGQSAGAFTATLPRDSNVAQYDVVYVPGPGAIAIGTVSSIDSDPASTDETIHIVPYVNIFSLTWVTVAE